MPTNSNSINFFSPAKWVVSKVAGEGTHTTIASALAVATSGDTIVVMPGTWNETLTLVAGVNLTTLGPDQNVIFTGNFAFSVAGTVGINGFQTQRAGSTTFSIGGTAASIVNITNCNFGSTGTVVGLSTANTSSIVNVVNCTGNVSTGVIFQHTGTGVINFLNCSFTNPSSFGTSNNNTGGGTINMTNTNFPYPIQASSTSAFNVNNCNIGSTANVGFINSGTGTSAFYNSQIVSGSNAAITIATGSTVTVQNCIINSTASPVISGAGSIKYSGLSFAGTGNLINVTTQTGSGTLIGTKFVASSAGFLGEQIRSTVASGSAITLTTATAANVTSISLTAGLWSISGLVEFGGNPTTSGIQQISINTTSATHGTAGDNSAISGWATANFSTGACPSTIPNWVLLLTNTATVFLVATGTFSAGAMNAYGRINAIRIA